MKKVVDDVIPTLKNMNYGHWGNPTQDDIVSLARWITLFTMSYEFADRATACIPFNVRSLFRETKTPSEHWNIAIGNGETETWSDVTFHRSMRLAGHIPHEGNRRFQMTAFRFGHLVILSHYADFSLGFDFSSAVKEIGLTPIWPNPPPKLTKPIYSHNDESINLIIAQMTNVVRLGVDKLNIS